MNKQSPHASALLITLLTVSLITILLVGYVTSMRIEITSSRSHKQGVQAGFFSQMGRDSALAQLKTALSSTNPLWIASQPGALSAYDTTNHTLTTTQLSSGFVAGNTAPNETVDLNAPGLEDDDRHLIAEEEMFPSGKAEMRVQWIYVDKEGALSTTGTATSVGRFAFWVDDESTKINVNTAWKRKGGNTHGLQHPSQVSLAALDLTLDEADAINTYRASNAINIIEDILRPAPGISNKVSANRFYLTAYNQAPALNVFGEPRIILTTQKKLAGNSSDFLDILQTEDSDPGDSTNLDASKITTQVNRIANYLKRKDWPLANMTGKSFADKFSPIPPYQLAIDIIEYVRARESKIAIIEPLRGSVTGGVYTYVSPSGTIPNANAISGNARGVRFTEMGIYISPLPVLKNPNGTPEHLVKLRTEVFLPRNFGLESVDLTKLRAGSVVQVNTNCLNPAPKDSTGKDKNYISGVNSNPIRATEVLAGAAPLNALNDGYVEGTGPSNYILPAGEYRIVSLAGRLAIFDTEGPVVGFRMGLREEVNGGRQELIPSVNQFISYITSPGASADENTIRTLAVDDPNVNKGIGDWVTPPANTLGKLNDNISTLGSPASSSITPQQDATAGGMTTDVGIRFPPPKGKSFTYSDGTTIDNTAGVMESVAELGFIHTGVKSLSLTDRGIPWRTLRLQPRRSADANTLPDWLLLDLFTVPQTDTSYFVKSENGLGGKINVNAALMPFVGTSGSSLLTSRALPIKAVLQGAYNGTSALSADEAADKAANIVNLRPATGGNPGNFHGFTNFYLTPGQIAEAEGVADGGEASETLLRNTVDLLTTRGSVFGIYSIGQSIRWRSADNVIILGERREHWNVERLQTTGSNTAKFRIFSSEDVAH